MSDFGPELTALGEHLSGRRDAVLQCWRDMIKADPTLTTSNALPRVQLNDHIPAVLAAFERELGRAPAAADPVGLEGIQNAAAHGLHRWQQGYDLREVTRELGRLNECMVVELETYGLAHPELNPQVMSIARRRWAKSCSAEVEASTSQFFELHQMEASGHVKDLERALEEVRELEQQRTDLWQQVAHDLRGNVGVVATVTSGLAQTGVPATLRDRFVKVLERNVGLLRHLLDDVTSLARLEAGREKRQLAQVDMGTLLQALCDGLSELAGQRRLTLRTAGAVPFEVEADAVKVCRIAQNLILNAVRYTREGSVTVSWGASDRGDEKRWALTIQDTGPGFHAGTSAPMAAAIETATHLPSPAEPAAGVPAGQAQRTTAPTDQRAPRTEGGEGIGLSIVKRLCELLDATVELESVPDVGTTFRILLPRKY